MLVLAVHHLGIEPFQEFFFKVLFTFVMEDSHEAWGITSLGYVTACAG